MSILPNQDQFLSEHVIEMLTTERAKALSKREWKHRIAGYGYAIRESDTGDVLETLPHRVEVCTLPAELCA